MQGELMRALMITKDEDEATTIYKRTKTDGANDLVSW